MKRKILVLSLAAIVLSVAGSAMSLSYLTDSDSSAASFTIGQVKIRTITASIPRYEGESTHRTDADLIENSLSYQEFLTDKCSNLLVTESEPVARCPRYVFVQNTGSVPAYVRIIVQIPVNAWFSDVGIEYNGTKIYNMTDAKVGVKCLSGEGYCTEYTFTKITPLEPGAMVGDHSMAAMTYSGSIAQATADDSGTEGSSVGVDLSNTGIRVYTQAIQAQGFSSAEEAFSNFK